MSTPPNVVKSQSQNVKFFPPPIPTSNAAGPTVRPSSGKKGIVSKYTKSNERVMIKDRIPRTKH